LNSEESVFPDDRLCSCASNSQYSNGLCSYPDAGVDLMKDTTATVDLEIFGPMGFNETLTAKGPTNVSRSDPYNDIDGYAMINTTIVFMNLTGFSAHMGPIAIVESPSKTSNGTIREWTIGKDFPADSFFDVYIEINTTFGTFHNDDPVHMRSVIYRIPPFGALYYPPVETIFLKNEAEGIVGRIVHATHKIEPPVGGVWVALDKSGLLVPYVAVASTVTIAAAATAIYVKRARKKKQ